MCVWGRGGAQAQASNYLVALCLPHAVASGEARPEAARGIEMAGNGTFHGWSGAGSAWPPAA